MTRLVSAIARRWRRLVAAVIAGVVVAVAGAVATYALQRPLVVNRKVQCLNSLGAVGIWVNVPGLDGFFATMHDVVDVSDGWYWTRFSAEIPNGGRGYSLNVGCGGNPKNWGMTAYSDTQSADSIALICNDIPPLLEFLGKKVFGQIFSPILVEAFGGIDIPYGRCEPVHQVGQLAPRPSLTEPIATLPPPQPALPGPPQPPVPQEQPQQPTVPREPPHQDPPQPTTWPGTIYNNAVFAVNVREGPDASYASVHKYAAGGGQSVTVVCLVNGGPWTDPTRQPSGNTWYRVSNPDGYIATGYVNVGDAVVPGCNQ